MTRTAAWVRCFEGAEKLLEAFVHGGHAEAAVVQGDAALLEKTTVAGAVRANAVSSRAIGRMISSLLRNDPIAILVMIGSSRLGALRLHHRQAGGGVDR